MLISSFYVVLFEENDEDFYRTTELLRWHHADVLVRRVTTHSELQVMGSDETTDLILIDIDNPSIGGPEGLDSFSSLMETFPVIAFGDRKFREAILASMRQGLQDFFAKWEVDRSQLGYLLARAWNRRHLINKLRLAEHRAWEEGEAKSRFLARMSHEIRTPLVSILGFSQLLADGRFKKNQAADFIRALQNNGRYLLSLLDNVLTSAQLERGEFRLHNGPVYLHEVLELVNAVADLQASAKGLTYSVQIRGDVPKRFLGDITRLTQVLVNLVVNAIKYTDHGQITLSVWREGEAFIEFAVNDSGCGLSEQGRRHLFQEFSRTEEVASHGTPGVGLGLFVAQSIVRKMGGYISVESEEGVGSTFRVVLPLHPVQEDTPIHDGDHPAQLSGHVLLVEDAIDSARYISLLLDTIGLTVEVAPTAEECLRQIESGERYDVILMDIGLPGMDGLSAIRELRARHVEVPILALSAHAFEETVDACLAAGADGYLTKPFRVQDFIRSVAARLGGITPAAIPTYPEETVVRTAVGKRPSTEARLQEIRRRFVSGLSDSLTIIRTAERKQNWGEVREVVHKIAGSAGLLGYAALSDRARDAENAIKRGEEGLFAETLDVLERELHQVVGSFVAVESNSSEGV
jgi:signal transduction histidine kinase/HPt (histidine-containing phosphotransfer) domain-containing protein